MDSTQNTDFEITHDWGDPREPEYRNGLLVSWANYREGSILLFFRVVGTRLPDSESVAWVLEAPKDTRKILADRWSDRWMIFERVIEYLHNLDISDQWQARGMTFSNVTVDTSQIPSWRSTKQREISAWLLPVSLKLPSRKTFPLLALGFGLAYFNQSSAFPLVLKSASSILVILLGIASLVILFHEARQNYEILKGFGASAALGNPSYKRRWRAVQWVARHYGYRYFVTAALAIVLVQMGWN